MGLHVSPCSAGAADAPLIDAIDGVLQLRLVVGEAVGLSKEVVGANQDDGNLGHVGSGHLPMQQPPPQVRDLVAWSQQ